MYGLVSVLTSQRVNFNVLLKVDRFYLRKISILQNVNLYM